MDYQNKVQPYFLYILFYYFIYSVNIYFYYSNENICYDISVSVLGNYNNIAVKTSIM